MRSFLSLALFLTLIISLCAAAEDLNGIMAKANAGDANAQYRLATMYSSGEGVARDMDQAFAWFSKAARQGHVGAMFNLGVAYYNGTTLGGTMPSDLEMAWVWFSLAAEKGDAGAKSEADRVWGEMGRIGKEGAELKLAGIFADGSGPIADGSRALEILKRSQSDRARVQLAQMYLDGKVIPRDLDAARKTCEPLAKARMTEGHYCMALIAEQKSDIAQAAKSYEAAARLGDRRAMYKLASFYAEGKGVPQDNLKAYVWSLIADGQREPAAKTLLASLEPKLSAKEIQKAKKEASKFNFAAGNPRLLVLPKGK